MTKNKIISFLKKTFSKDFVAPIVTETNLPQTEKKIIDEAIKKKKDEIDIKYKEREKEVNARLNGLLQSYLGKPYQSQGDMKIAYDIHQRQWLEYVRKSNSTSRFGKIKKDAFKQNVVRILLEYEQKEKIKELENSKTAELPIK